MNNTKCMDWGSDVDWYVCQFFACKNCGELDYLTSKVFCNLTDFGAKCEKCETINTVTIVMGELKKLV
ncbi:MAG: hypothetical protein WBM37_09560 [Nitrososphaeraceae archaeon]